MEIKEFKNQLVIIDSNILTYCWDKQFGLGAQQLLRTLKDNGNRLAISYFTVFEVLKNAIDDRQRKYYIELVNYIDQIPLSLCRLLNGCVLYHNYHKEFNKKCTMESGDVIIGGTAIHDGGLVLTANRDHFPAVFWKNVAQDHIIHQIGEKKYLTNIYLLELDLSKLTIKKDKLLLYPGIYKQSEERRKDNIELTQRIQ